MAPSRDVGDASRSRSTTDRLLGELIAEVRALKHGTANNTQKLEAVSTVAANQTEMLHRMEKLELEKERHHARIVILERDKDRRDGAIGLFDWVGRHWPFPIISAALAAWIAWANGKFHL